MPFLSRWNDFRWGELDRTHSALEEMQRQLDRMYGDFFRGGTGSPARAERTWPQWPRANLYDTGSEFVLMAECPGLSENDVDIQLHQDALTISGERKSDLPEGYSVHRKERGVLRFSRTFTMPFKVDPERCEASLKNGLLLVKLGKAPEAQPRQISVRSN